jgi:DNA-binding transcriptional MocR family regulator
MSIAARFAWLRAVAAADPRPTLAELAVAVALAEHFNEARGAAWPSSRGLAEMLRMERRTIRRALRGLEERGFIAPAPSRSRAKGYALAEPQVSGQVSGNIGEEGATERPTWAPQSALNGRPTAPLMGALQPPEQVSRNENVGKPYTSANARFADAPRAGAGSKRKRKPSIPSRI